MSRAQLILATILVAALGLGAGLALQSWMHARPVEISPFERPTFSLPTPDGTLRDIAEWDGKVLLVNFWATWCPPCRREIPLFIELQEELGERGLQVVGVAIDEAQKVAEFAASLGINYPSLVGNAQATRVSTEYGNELGVLPFTAIVDRNGQIVHQHRGEVTRDIAERLLLPLL
jgi:thiol-disulfide isomerase/thioredoxin